MPTGYTQGILDGTITDFKGFASTCMRAFGAAMHKEEIMTAHYAPQYGCFSKDYYNETFNNNGNNNSN